MEAVKTLFDRLQENPEANKKHFTNLLLQSLLGDEEFMNAAAADFINNQEEPAKQIYNLAEDIRTEYVERERIDAMKNRTAEEYLSNMLYCYFDYYEIAKAVLTAIKEKKAA